MSGILPQIKHIVVVMLSGRSLDNACGWLYKPGRTQPSQFLPASSPQVYDGLKSTHFNPVSELYFTGQSTETYPVFDQANATNMPDPGPAEDFDNVTYQLFGPEAPSPNPTWPNLGFVINYAKVTTTNISVQVMEPFSPAQLPVLSALATNYAISDAWFSSVPSQTWPNRSFVHAGTSNGNINNGTIPNPFDWDVRNIFNVLEDIGAYWRRNLIFRAMKWRVRKERDQRKITDDEPWVDNIEAMPSRAEQLRFHTGQGQGELKSQHSPGCPGYRQSSRMTER